MLGMRSSSDSVKSGQTEQARASCDELSIEDKAYTVHEGSVTEGDLKLEILDTNVDAASAIEKIKFAEPPWPRKTTQDSGPGNECERGPRWGWRGYLRDGQSVRCVRSTRRFLTVKVVDLSRASRASSPAIQQRYGCTSMCQWTSKTPVLVMPVPNVGNVVMGLPSDAFVVVKKVAGASTPATSYKKLLTSSRHYRRPALPQPSRDHPIRGRGPQERGVGVGARINGRTHGWAGGIALGGLN